MNKPKRCRPATKIPLKFGRRRLFAVVDEKDAFQGEHAWHAIEAANGKLYARRADYKTGRRRNLFLHREIMQAPFDMEVDHRNGDSLDCRRSNLRLATRQQNMCNMRRPSHNTSGFKGVAKAMSGRWRAFIKINRKQLHLGVFDRKRDAAKAYDRAALEHFGEFANLNFAVRAARYSRAR